MWAPSIYFVVKMLLHGRRSTLSVSALRRTFATSGLPKDGKVPSRATLPPNAPSSKPDNKGSSTGLVLLTWTAIPAGIYFYSKFNPEWAPPGLESNTVWKSIHEKIHPKPQVAPKLAATAPISTQPSLSQKKALKEEGEKKQPEVADTEPVSVPKAKSKEEEVKAVEKKKSEAAVVKSAPTAATEPVKEPQPVVLPKSKTMKKVEESKVVESSKNIKSAKEPELVVKAPKLAPVEAVAKVESTPKKPQKSLEVLSNEMKELEKMAKEFSSSAKVT